MTFTTPNPTDLVRTYSPFLRRLAWRCGLDEDETRATAWQVFYEVQGQDEPDFIPKWLLAVETHCAGQRPGVILRPSEKKKEKEEFIGTAWLLGSAADDPYKILEGVEEVLALVEGQDVAQLIDQPRTTREIADATGKSQRQARRLKKKLEVVGGSQSDFWRMPT